MSFIHDPWETQDKEDLAETYYNHHLREQNRSLDDENMMLKRLLRENGVAWSAISRAHLGQKASSEGPGKRISTRRSLNAASKSPLPFLPMEIQLRILKFALTSSQPIIDPLCKLKKMNITAKEHKRGNQVAIHFLATCKAMRIEGTRIFWGQNSFIFTHPEALRRFAEVDYAYRQDIRHVQFRIIAQFYDDRKRPHTLPRNYHSTLKKATSLPIRPRVDEQTFARGGYRCYSWTQITDFLQAMRPPFDPEHDKKTVRPRLLPYLESLRIDLVNFGTDQLPMFGNELHNMASHELGCTLNEILVTGLPKDDPGLKAHAELGGLLRDEGLMLTGVPSYMQTKRGLQALDGNGLTMRIVRSWKSWRDEESMMDDDSVMADDEEDEMPMDHSHGPVMPAAPRETGHPDSPGSRNSKTIWKRVPVSRDSQERKWVEFCRNGGYAVMTIKDDDSDSTDEDMMDICPCCGEFHPGAFFDMFDDEFDEEDLDLE